MKRLVRIIKETNTAAISGGIRGLGNVTGDPAIADEHVSGYISDNQAYTEKLKGNITNGLYGFEEKDDEWSMSQKEVKTMKRIFHKSFKTLREEIANVAGSGEIAGLGVTPPDKPANWGEPGVSNKKQKKPSVLRRPPPLNEERRNEIEQNFKLDRDTKLQDIIDDFNEPPHEAYDAGDGKHFIHVWNHPHPDNPSVMERTTIFTNKQTGHTNARIDSRVIPSQHDDREELHHDMLTRGRTGGPKGFVADAYHMLMNGRAGKYAIINHGSAYVDPSGQIHLANSSRSKGAHGMIKRLKDKYEGVIHSIYDPKTGDLREPQSGGFVATTKMANDPKLNPLTKHAAQAIPQTMLDPEHRGPQNKPIWVNKK